MRPDRLVGLKNTTRYRQSALARASDGEYMPTENRNLLLPFLILEAKREKGAPGFRAIEMQTAFPIRSLLNLQDKLKRDSRRVLHPLVWFFGFQGDIWRLYAGTVRQDEIAIYDLWLGSIDSKDSALQIFQIVDFIWSWARDVYRPQVRRCLEDRSFMPREPSPTSTMIISRAPSILSDRTAPPQEPLQTATNQVLRPGNGDALSTGQTCIRRANAIIFTFQFLPAFPYKNPHEDRILQPLVGLKMLLRITIQQRDELKRRWTGTPEPIRSETTLSAGAFVFRTFCDQNSWQIRRKRYFINMTPTIDILGVPDEDLLDVSSRRDELAGAIEAVRGLTGAASVAYALQGIDLVLARRTLDLDRDGVEAGTSSSLSWQQVPKGSAFANQIAHILDTERSWTRLSETGDLELLLDQEFPASPLPVQNNHYLEIDLPLPDHVNVLPAMLTARPSSWGQDCPRFCLFVFRQADFDDRARHRQLLQLSLSMRRYYSIPREQPVLSDADRATLREWVRSLRSF